MTRVNYSKDAPLLDEEILDYDTLNYNETEINDGRMRLPSRYDISKFYQRNKRNRGKHRAGEYGRWKNKEVKDLPDISDDFDWQITYAFPVIRRNPKTASGAIYGGKHVTFRRLYLILCEHFNGGEYFIDTYFDSVYPYTVKPIIDEKLSVVKQELIELADSTIEELNEINTEEGLEEVKINKDGSLSRSAKSRNKRAYKALEEYETFAQAWEDSEGEEVASLVKEDIISCVTSGQLPCQFTSPAKSTMRKRLSAGLGGVPLFSATEQLINSIQLFVKIGGNGEWRTQSGLVV